MGNEVAPFILFPDERLQAAAARAPVDAALLEIGEKLQHAAREAMAYGLAAVHIGVVAPVAVVSIVPPPGRDYRVLFNPWIIELGGDPVPGKEGSVSMPDIEVEISRPSVARIGFEDETGATVELELNGFPARVAQHEIDQVNGVFFLNRLSRLKREAAIKRYAKLARRMG
ncbi:peptide deformylase [Devosia subaequoris]|uniref:Peptide deformylase-like n=1 Tax=Devosia subaequoris TaxID=395930 RepID=A0A7W6IJB4_9HYPH|nr:peptide deformylase [Devosia subaequoris]MBB4050670.1 peptide deformylase [Devosia subaequoris]MCP1208649.1 peptide deformylase [Devosia subaequoris]